MRPELGQQDTPLGLTELCRTIQEGFTQTAWAAPPDLPWHFELCTLKAHGWLTSCVLTLQDSSSPSCSAASVLQNALGSPP